ncbi:hypothetical protein GLOIN_2v956376 [Rhizophagus irregularis DAOM 181602=DAOM 197198]|uniref:Uncharacterized protein n=1 Tax=Rhizophagus irregularis (strain DAOM 181602 / DAOM 197198 / MUCL 43194) TaxID=747089 RepID=A0A2P4QD91_RHIID|nr:hypothetical protein GLOIN_2v956376 [Rhizophagus irregularis DAOM 181602=DAOM 197198]POG75598.1 hypothetical protein GLOIN_2v956376 [Rhizophagus irregularis DAOM 181602=DAOM 197198]|eukprot:XP_025182464.1 hypothetical protein GLOIN_2v956376 [Rhizophagus irregularis DAOM 181602=DAOM 197198]
MVELKFLKSVMVISIEDIHYIYSNRMDFPIKIIEGSNSINNLIKSCLEINNNLNYFNNILFRLNDQKAFGIFHEKPWVINMKKCDLETYIINDKYIDSEEISDIKDSNNENILYKIGNQYTTTPDENELIKKYIIPNLVNSNENQNEYYMRLTFKNGEFILEAFINNSFQNRPSYKIRYSNWKYIIDNNTHILYDDTELHIYTFNIESKKIELQLCYNIKFLKYAIKLYNNNNEPDALEIDEIKEIAQPTNNELKKQWILYATNQKYFLVYYGEKLLKSAIKQHNIELIKLIYTKTLKYFKENPNNNIQFLAYYEEKLLKSENKELIELIYTETLKYFKENPNNNIQFLVYYEKFLKQQNKELMELIYTETLKCFKENKENPNINIQFLAYYGEKLLKSENKELIELIYTETLKYFKENSKNNIQFLVYYEKFLKSAIKQQNKKLIKFIYTKTLEYFKKNPNNNNIQFLVYCVYCVYYGEKLLKSAIKRHNRELIKSIYNKTLEYFKENPNNNIHILSLICKNMPYLNQNYSEFLSEYYNVMKEMNKMNLFSENSLKIYNNLQHLYSYNNELKISKNKFILHKLKSYSRPLKFLKSRIYLLVLFSCVIRFYS